MKVTCSQCDYRFAVSSMFGSYGKPESATCPHCGNKITLTDVKYDRMLNSNRDKTIITK